MNWKDKAGKTIHSVSKDFEANQRVIAEKAINAASDALREACATAGITLDLVNLPVNVDKALAALYVARRNATFCR